MRFELLRVNEVNQNGRMYTKEAVKQMIEDFERNRDRVGAFYGQMGMNEGMDINLSKISHTVDELHFDGDRLYGEIKILDTDAGKKLKPLIEEGQVVFRSRSIGTVNEDGMVEVKKLISFDAIPSWEDAFKPEDRMKYLVIS